MAVFLPEWVFKPRANNALPLCALPGLCLCVFIGAVGKPDLDILRVDAFPPILQGQELGAGERAAAASP